MSGQLVKIYSVFPSYQCRALSHESFLIAIALTDIGDDSDSPNDSFTDSNIPIVDNLVIPTIEEENQGINPGEGTLEIPEPSDVTGFFILSSVILLFIRKKIKV